MENRASRLKSARESAGYTSARSAAIAHGWAVSTYTAHENGQNDFDVELASTYAKAFQTTAEQILFAPSHVASDASSIDQQLRTLPPAVSRELISKFNAMIEGVRIGRKLK